MTNSMSPKGSPVAATANPEHPPPLTASRTESARPGFSNASIQDTPDSASRGPPPTPNRLSET
jgi:hypothetical protein